MQPFAVRRVSIPLEPPSGPARACSVLLVTDDDQLREAAARVLSMDAFLVRTAGHAGHALLACLDGARIDVLVCELSMRDTSGPALAARLRRHHPDLPVVYLAQAGTPECDGLLVRPFTRDDLVRALQRAAAAAASAAGAPAS